MALRSNRGRGTRGPQAIPIDWPLFYKYAECGNNQREIAAFFNISEDTLADAYLSEHGVKLSEFFAKKKDHRNARLRYMQWESAEKGDTSMRIFLGKVYLNQTDKPLDEELLKAAQKSGMSRDQLLALLNNPQEFLKQNTKPKKFTFAEFCVNAGYFEPYDKQRDMVDFGFKEILTRLLLGARGYGKTDFVTIAGTAYELYECWYDEKDPSEFTTLIITKSDKRNAAILNEIKIMLEKNGVPLDKANASVLRLMGLIGQDHSVEAITIKSSMRGRHPKRIIMDDPVTDEDVSEAMRKLVKRRYDEAYKLCKNILIIGQPAHAHDLYAQLRGIIKTMEVPHGTIPELDADLEAMRMAGIDEASIQMSYHLRVPVSGTAAFAKIKRIDKMPENVQTVCFLDPSDGGDYTAITIIAGYFDGIAVVGFNWKMAWYHCLDEIVAKFKQFKVGRVCFETNSTGKQPIIQLSEKLKPLGIGVVGKHSDKNKHAVIMQAGTYADRIHLSKESGKDYTDHVIQYEYGAEFDDAPDSLARGMEWLGLIKGRV